MRTKSSRSHLIHIILFCLTDKVLHRNEKALFQAQKAKTGFDQRRHFMRILFPIACVNRVPQLAMILLLASEAWSQSLSGSESQKICTEPFKNRERCILINSWLQNSCLRPEIWLQRFVGASSSRPGIQAVGS
jgi:hypothetical protein